MNRKKIAVVSIMYFWLPEEKGPSRFFYIANMLGEMGYDVEVLTGSFQHFDKRQRDRAMLENADVPFKITVIDQPSYSKNIDLKRLSGYRTVKKHLESYLKDKITEYDAVYCAVPPNDISAAVARLCHENNVPFIADIEDLWPEAMEAVLPKVPGLKMFLAPLKKDAEETYMYADAAVGTSDEYTSRCFLNNKREIPHATVYVGCDLTVFDKGVIDHSARIMKSSGEFWAVYAGSIGHTYDIETLVRAAGIIKERGINDIKIKILGQGVLMNELKVLAEELGCTNLEFLGYQPYDMMAAYLVKGDVSINMFAKGAPQSIVNKVGDYFSSGRPVINTLESPEFMQLLESTESGTNVEPGKPGLLADAIIHLYNNKELCEKMGRNARALAEERFDRKTAYKAIVRLIEEVTN
ncbi:MAG: glycosyltransferase family 4 protein [Lachnospiraceae bacterium]|nr:glycosyltransferase family 4 protein [Lachnospiraceae bacterium]